MNTLQKLFRAYAKTLVVFATFHLLIVIWYVLKNNAWHLLLVGEIWEVKYLVPTYTPQFVTEVLFAVIILAVFVYFWIREKRGN
jgi:hypothetical protein